MKEKLRNMYEESLIDTTALLNAVAKNWIMLVILITMKRPDLSTTKRETL